MTDRELLELAAKAAGYKIAWEGGCVTGWMAGGSWWNPLTDDGDALRLAVKLALLVDVIEDDTERCTEVVWAWCYTTRIRQNHDGDPYAATRRAIVRAAAAIQQAKERT